MKKYTCKIRRSTGEPLVVKVDARTIREVARTVRRLYPDHKGFRITETSGR